MGLKDLFSRKSDEALRKDAKALFEKVCALDADVPVNRKAKIQQALLMRNFVDQTFVDSCKAVESYEIAILSAMREGKKAEIAAPEPSEYQVVKSGQRDVWVYGPKEFAFNIFRVAAKYQRAEVSKDSAIELTQSQYDEVCESTLGVVNDINVLNFLRDEEVDD